jgi:hypothetical protein
MSSMRVFSLLGLVALLSCAAATEPSDPDIRVLFLGNSLTYVNDLPAMVRAIGAADGVTIRTKMMAHPNWGIQDHWEQGDAVEEIAAEKWDIVVMQQGPSASEQGGIDLMTWSAKFGALAAANNTCLAMYMVWSSADRLEDFDDVYNHYKAAADANNGKFLPAGEAWLLAWGTSPSLPFYGNDGFHPSPLGTYLAALVVYGGVTGRSPAGNSASISGVSVNASTKSELQNAAVTALAGAPKKCEGLPAD